MQNSEFLASHGYFFASNDEQLAWAKNNPDLMPLADVIQKLEGNLSQARAGYMFVPNFYSHFDRKELLPIWVWRLMGWKIRPLQKDDIVGVRVKTHYGEELEVMGRVGTIQPNRVEVCLFNTHQCIHVNAEDILEYNQD